MNKANLILEHQGQLLKKYRKENSSLTMAQAAEKIGKSQTWLSDIENGRNNIYAQDIVKLLNVYHVDINFYAKDMTQYMDKINE